MLSDLIDHEEKEHHTCLALSSRPTHDAPEFVGSSFCELCDGVVSLVALDIKGVLSFIA